MGVWMGSIIFSRHHSPTLEKREFAVRFTTLKSSASTGFSFFEFITLDILKLPKSLEYGK